jgi:hypothetical protein
MTIIQNYFKYTDFRLFDPFTQTISLDLLNEVRASEKIYGFFACLGGMQCVLYRQQGRLMLSVKGINSVFDDLSVSTMTISRIVSGDIIYFLRHITISDDSQIIFETDYTENGPYFENDVTMYEVEDFDFGLFLENLSKNRERRNVIFTSK